MFEVQMSHVYNTKNTLYVTMEILRKDLYAFVYNNSHNQKDEMVVFAFHKLVIEEINCAVITVQTPLRNSLAKSVEGLHGVSQNQIMLEQKFAIILEHCIYEFIEYNSTEFSQYQNHDIAVSCDEKYLFMERAFEKLSKERRNYCKNITIFEPTPTHEFYGMSYRIK